MMKVTRIKRAAQNLPKSLSFSVWYHEWHLIVFSKRPQITSSEFESRVASGGPVMDLEVAKAGTAEKGTEVTFADPQSFLFP